MRKSMLCALAMYANAIAFLAGTMIACLLTQ